MKTIKELYGDRKLIIGRDRLDQYVKRTFKLLPYFTLPTNNRIKGVEHKLNAFKRFLTDHPGILLLSLTHDA